MQKLLSVSIALAVSCLQFASLLLLLPAPALAACSGVSVTPSSGIQNAVNANGNGTTFCLAAGTYHETVVPQSGDSFIGAGIGQTILDGSGLSSSARCFDTENSSSNNVTIKYLTCQNYPDSRGDGGGIKITNGSSGWVVDTVETANNVANGICVAVNSNTTIRNAYVHDNGLTGLCTINANNLIVDNSDFYHNNLSHQSPCGVTASVAGTHYISDNGTSITNSRFRDNYGNGIWLDLQNDNWTIAYNEFFNNETGSPTGCGSSGAGSEVGQPHNGDPTFYNTFHDNYAHNDGQEFWLANAGNWNIYNNTFVSSDGATIIYAPGDEGARTDLAFCGSGGGNCVMEYDSFHNNIVAVTSGGLAFKGTDGTTPGSDWASHSNAWNNNTYYLPSTSAAMFYCQSSNGGECSNGATYTFSQWQALGFHPDANSTINTSTNGTLPTGVGPRGGFQCLAGMTWCGGGTTTGGTTGGTTGTTCTPSASGTTIPSASQILDGICNVWTVSSGQISENGTVVSGGGTTNLLLWYSGSIYTEYTNTGASSPTWYQRNSTDNGWNVISGDPRPSTTTGGTTGGTTGTTPAPCTNAYTPSVAIPSGYGAAYDLTGGGQMEVQANCAKTTPTLDIGRNNQSDYVYKLGYLYQNNAWQPYTLTSSSALVSSNWFPAFASVSLPSGLPSSSWTYAVGYVCSYVNSAWKCGCADSACTTGYWQLQAFER